MFAAANKPRVEANLNEAFRVVETEKMKMRNMKLKDNILTQKTSALISVPQSKISKQNISTYY